jgi:RHS repeat-associated protein
VKRGFILKRILLGAMVFAAGLFMYQGASSAGTTIQYLYENTSYPFALTGITDENGNRYQTWTYDNTGRATSSQSGTNGIQYTSVSYDDTTGNRVVRGPLGILETYKFTTLQGVPKVTQVDRAANGTVAAASSFYTYDSAGYLASHTDWNGNQTVYTNNANGDPTQILYASGSSVAQTVNIAYDGTWAHLPRTVNSNGLNITNTYDATYGNLLYRSATDTTTQSVPYSTNGETRIWAFTYTSTGQLASAQLPRTDVTAKTSYGYTGGTLTSITDALSHTTSVITYKSGGLPLTVTDPNGTLTTFAYNNRNWMTSSVMSVSGGSLTTSFQYDSAGNLTRTTLPDSSYLAYAYDDAHLPTTITNALSESQAITYDSAGNVTQVLFKNSGGTNKFKHTATFDALGRIKTDVGGVGQTTTFTYDNNGNTLTIKDPLNRTTTQTFDALNRLSTVKNPLLDTARITYDSHSRPLTVTDYKGNATSYVYNGFGDLIQQTSPDSLTTVWVMSKDGFPTQQTDASGTVTNMTYDALDRILTRAFPADATLNVAFTYDQTGHGQGIGQLTSLTDQAGSLSRNYEERGLLTSDARTIGTQTYTTGYTYQSAGSLSSITYASSGWKVSYTRDAAGQISSVTAKPPASGTVNVATSISYQPFGPMKNLTWANGVTSARIFDVDYRMTSLTDTGTSGNIQFLSYGYDANNNVTGIGDNVTPTNTQVLTYDTLSRINYASGSYGIMSSITYDSNSNLTRYNNTGYTVASTNNQQTKSGSTNITYTSTGGMSAVGTTTMTYNKADQLATSTAFGTTNTYGYDAFGQRLTSKAGTANALIHQYDQDMGLIETAGGSGVAITDYVYLDGMPLAQIKPSTSTIYALHTDSIDTPLRGTDPTQAVVMTANYAPYGATTPTGTLTTALRRPGQFLTDASPFYRNGYRDMYGLLGRYLEVDPIGLQGGINPYMYALENPYKYIDPSGLILQFIPIAAEAVIAISPEAIEALSLGAARAAAILRTRAAATAAGTVATEAAAALRPTGTGAQCTVETPAPDFIATPGGTVFPVPQGATGPYITNNGLGMQYQGGMGGYSLDPRVTGFRYSSPTTTGRYPYPQGRGTYNNITGQAVNPLSGQTIPPSDPWAHISGGN